MTRCPTPRSLRAVLSIATLFATTAACASSTIDRAAPHGRAQVNPRLHAELPTAVRARGVLRIVTDASYAPASSFAPNGRTVIGFEPDLGEALGQLLGVRVVFTDDDFSALPAIVRSGRADMIMSAMTDTAQREQRLDFVDYFSAGTALVVQRGNAHGISDLESLCGQRVAVETGTVQADLLSREQARCGTRRITILTTPTNDDALVLLRTGRAAALPMDFPPAEDLTARPRTRAYYQLASTTQYEPGLYGIGFAKNQQVLRDIVQAALATLIRTGVYRRILTTWHVADGAVSQSSINAARIR